MRQALGEVTGVSGAVFVYDGTVQANVGVILCEGETAGTDAAACGRYQTDLEAPRPGIGDAETWGCLLAASEATSLSFLADEPDIYGEEDGEPI